MLDYQKVVIRRTMKHPPIHTNLTEHGEEDTVTCGLSACDVNRLIRKHTAKCQISQRLI